MHEYEPAFHLEPQRGNYFGEPKTTESCKFKQSFEIRMIHNSITRKACAILKDFRKIARVIRSVGSISWKDKQLEISSID